ncbi:nuclear transport factor 2 family protein [Dankookia sp. GCM10030260]|uniref:nuclear transport factor 2 family protein n=1 Tax=Dankookia sp. GCM10030260 TaxID=3273390 RepID=UPI00360DC250
MTDPEARAPQPQEPNYDRLLRANLERVFSERDAAKRAAALDELFVEEPVMYEPTNIVSGRAAISAVVSALLEQFGPDLRFRPEGVAVGHHGVGCLRWQAGPEGGPVTVTGIDAAEVVDGRIARLWVLLDPPRTA